MKKIISSLFLFLVFGHLSIVPVSRESINDNLNDEVKTNQNYFLDGVEVQDSSMLINDDANSINIALQQTRYINDWNIVSKDLNTGVLNFIDFDPNGYLYREFAFDETEYSSKSADDVSISKNKVMTTSDINTIANPDDTISLYTEGYNPNSNEIVSSLPSTRDVIGTDDRVWVPDTTLWPYRAAGYLLMRFDVINNVTGLTDHRYFIGSGFLEGPDLLVTAGHCTYGDVTKSYTSNGVVYTQYEDYLNNPRFPDEITYYPAQNGPSVRPYGQVSVDRVYIEKSYYLYTQKDWACCKLSSPIGYQTGWLGKIGNFYQQNYPFVSFGYPGSKGGKMYVASAEFTYFETDNGWYYRTNLDAEGGQSGSPYRVTVDGGDYISGIHTYSVGSSYTGGIRIDIFMFHFLNSFVTTNVDVYDVAQNDYGFADAYPTDTTTSTNYLTHELDSGLSFKTRRYRTGFIQNEYVVMSCIKTNITKAFIEYRFEDPVNRIDVELTHWREYASEWLDKDTGVAELQILDGATWIEKFDLLADETALPRNRNNPTTYTIKFDTPVYRFRFYSEVNNAQSSSSNRGRICIGNMRLWFPKNHGYLPLSGSELNYEPGLWNNSSVSYYNCYAYALNTKNYGFMQPGQSVGHTTWTHAEITNPNTVLYYVNLDSANYGFTFTSVGRNDVCPDGTYKVALVIDNETTWYNSIVDYHWYRQDSDGTWSHKPGGTNVTNKDYSNNLIYDPQYCNRNAGGGLNYNLFVGYFAISPLG